MNSPDTFYPPEMFAIHPLCWGRVLSATGVGAPQSPKDGKRVIDIDGSIRAEVGANAAGSIDVDVGEGASGEFGPETRQHAK